MWFDAWLALGVLAIYNTVPLAEATPKSSPVSNANPCAAISSLQAAQTNLQSVPAELAYQCLQSVPIDTSRDIQLIQELKLFLNWQSNIAYLKNPPPGSPQPAVDLFDRLNRISYALSNGTNYTSEYEVQAAITSTFQDAHDGHLAFVADILQVFTFDRQCSLVSISEDGRALPKLYLLYDIDSIARGAEYSPSAVTSINGRSSDNALRGLDLSTSVRGSDARYNAHLFNQAGLFASQRVGGFRYSGLYPGAVTEFGLENGTTISTKVVAILSKNLKGVDSGKAFFSKFCTGGASTTEVARPTKLTGTFITSPTKAVVPGYPIPISLHSEGAVAGYFLNDNYDNVAVLTIHTFAPRTESFGEFQAVVKHFLDACRVAGKSKLIVDIRNNPGGDSRLAYDIFKRLFPDAGDPYDPSRFRNHEACNILGQFYFDRSVNGAVDGNLLSPQFWVNSTYGRFESWRNMYGPYGEYNGDKFSAMTFENLTYQHSTVQITGYQKGEKIERQPFTAQDVVMLMDGHCASSCAILFELLRTQGGVKSLVIGGQPSNAPMEAVGGVRGRPIFRYDQIESWISRTYLQASAKEVAAWNKTKLGAMKRIEVLPKRAAVATVNFGDVFRIGDETQTPLEFVYDPADCRIFYTMGMIHNVTQTWQATVDAMWHSNGTRGCVPGSTDGVSSLRMNGNMTHGKGV